MKRVLIVSIASKYSKYPLPKIWVAYLSAEELAQLLNCEVVDYRCGHGDPSAYWDEIIQMIIDLQIDVIIVPNLASIAIHIADGAELLHKLNALGVELYPMWNNANRCPTQFAFALQPFCASRWSRPTEVSPFVLGLCFSVVCGLRRAPP